MTTSPNAKHTPGNPYSSDATWEVSVTLANDAKVHEQVDKLRDKRGLVTGAALQRTFGSKLRSMNVSALAQEVSWDEVAEEFNPEPLELERQAAERAGRRIDDDVLQVLRGSSADAEGVTLPPGQLDRKLYSRVNDVLLALGGKWHSRKKKHLFEDDPQEVLALAQATGSFVSPKDFGFFPTPAEVGRKLIEFADLEPDMLVLEPSAGHGALMDLAAAVVGRENVIGCELLQANLKKLETKGYSTMAGDFLAMEPEPIFDRVIMNPPFSGLADIAHVEHAARFLKPGGKLVAITSPSFTFHQNKKAQAFRELLDSAGELLAEVEAGAFKSSGTDVRTVMISLDADRLPWNLEDEESYSSSERMTA
jgi:predicted RNA methylase